MMEIFGLCVLIFCILSYPIQGWILKIQNEAGLKMSMIIISGTILIGFIFYISGIGHVDYFGRFFDIIGVGIMCLVWLLCSVIHGFCGHFKEFPIKK